jgi:hypothetical protein
MQVLEDMIDAQLKEDAWREHMREVALEADRTAARPELYEKARERIVTIIGERLFEALDAAFHVEWAHKAAVPVTAGFVFDYRRFRLFVWGVNDGVMVAVVHETLGELSIGHSMGTVWDGVGFLRLLSTLRGRCE